MNTHNEFDLGGGTWSGLLRTRASVAPDSVVLAYGDRELTYGELDTQATRVAAGLIASGLKPGDSVGIFLTNCPEYLIASYGLNRAGLVRVSINTSFKASFLSYPMELTNVRLLITESFLLPALLSIRDDLSKLLTIVFVDAVPSESSKIPTTSISWDELLASGNPAPTLPAIGPSDTSEIIFTSGTTGRSKGILSPNLQGVIFAKEAANAFNLNPRDRLYTCMPLFHGMAQFTTSLAAIYAGATIVLAKSFSVSRFWSEIRENRATQASALGSMLHMLLTPPPSPKDREHLVTRLFSAPAPADVLYRFERRYGTHIIEGYGMSEIKNVLYNPIVGRKIGSMGRPTPTSIVEIHDDEGNKLAPGGIGEIVYRPKVANIMAKGYLGEPEKSLASMRGLWWRTGDMGYMDEDGYFFFFDRTSDRLRRRGENISSHEVERTLSTFPGISEVAAIAARSEVGEDEVMVVMEASDPPNIDLKGVLQHCIDNMPRFMVPRYYRLVKVMPRTLTGKVTKNELRNEGITRDTWDRMTNADPPSTLS